MEELVRISLSFDGATAANGAINFYDVQRALYGFQRSLALTTHLAINGEIITQAPALKNAEILLLAPERGSWKATAIIGTLVSGTYLAGTAPKDTPLGHLVSSLYDYALHNAVGIDLDYEKTIRQTINERDISTQSIPTPERLNSLVEKIQKSVIEMHRPIEMGSAEEAQVNAQKGDRLRPLGPRLNLNTFRAAQEEIEGAEILPFRGRISSYNMNTFTGRIYLPSEQRTVPFELSREYRTKGVQRRLARSLDDNIEELDSAGYNIELQGISYYTRSGALSKIIVVQVITIK